ncbi:MAG: sugar transferase, partial [Thermoanaerobaculia bacterium]
MIRLFSRYWSVPAAISLVAEGILLSAAFVLAIQLRLGLGPGNPPPLPIVIQETLAFMIVGLLSLYMNGLYDFGERLTVRQLTVALLRAFTLGALALAGVFFFIPSIQAGRGVFLMAFLFAMIAVTSWRVILRWLLNTDRFAERVLIVGTDEKAIDIARETLSRKHLGFRVIGFLDDDPKLQGVSLLNPRVIGTTAQACQLARQHGATRVVVAALDYRGRVSMDSLLECKTSGIRVQEGSSYYEQLTGKIMVEGLRKSWLIFSDGFVVSRGVLFSKRLLDIAVASIGLILALPFMVLVAIAVKLDSPGPMLFSQERVGRGRKPFRVYKFRSMRTDAE